MLVRGHEPCLFGYQFLWNKRLITIFSASNYMKNKDTDQYEGYGTALFIAENKQHNESEKKRKEDCDREEEVEVNGRVRVRFNLAPGQLEPSDCPFTGGGRTHGSSIARTVAPFEGEEEEGNIPTGEEENIHIFLLP